MAAISGTTVWRWLSEDAIKPWQHRSWIFPRDPDFEAKASQVLDLYARTHHRKPLRSNDYVISADEKPGIQARIRKKPHSTSHARHTGARRTRVPPRRRPGLPRRLGRPP